ncbi:MAG TPA: hypothetical protein VHX16_12810, partial [Chloroflexota bacterium]|nr:hypothetical protein [Chloroflexota bacterium]
LASNQLVPLPEPARRGLINLADDAIAYHQPGSRCRRSTRPQRRHPINQIRSGGASRAFGPVASDHPPA